MHVIRMNKRKRALVLCLVGLVSGPCWSEDLLGIYREALGSDAQFSAARSRAEAGREFAVQGRAGLLPNIGASGDTTFNNVDVEGQSSKANRAATSTATPGACNSPNRCTAART